MTEYEDEQGNTVGPGYAISEDGDLAFFASPSLLGHGKKPLPEPEPIAEDDEA